jgi:phosphohistidine phosphatase SixA
VKDDIAEQIKWIAPSFSYKDYIATFNLRARSHVHLISHNPIIAQVKSGLLEGDYKDRRMAYFSGMDDVRAKRAELENVVQELVQLMDEQQPS